MKVYEEMGYGDNLGICKPYSSADGRFEVSLYCDEIIKIRIDGKDVPYDEDRQYTQGYSKALVNTVARIINPDYVYYDDLDDTDDTEIILDALVECGCADCPWRDDCDAMEPAPAPFFSRDGDESEGQKVHRGKPNDISVLVSENLCASKKSKTKGRHTYDLS